MPNQKASDKGKKQPGKGGQKMTGRKQEAKSKH